MKNTEFLKYISLVIILLFNAENELQAQIKSIGLPEVRNYTTAQTMAGAQTWDIIEDRLGNVYFGNEHGIYKYDGEDWILLKMKNNSETHSLALGADGNIYAGGYTEIGVITVDSTGKSVYESLNHLIPERFRNFSVIWKIYQTRYGIIFQSYEYLFIKNQDTIQVIEPENSFGFSYYINNNFYIIEKERGLRIFLNGELKTISNDPVFTEDEIRFILPFRSNDLLVGAFTNGLYILNGNGLKKWETPMNQAAQASNLYNGSVSGNYFIFGTVKDGVYIVDKNGNITQHLNRTRGLQNNTVLSHFSDSKGNLWLGLDNGIDYLKISLPLSFINHNFNVEAVYCSIVHNERLYVGTNQGLFMKPLSELSNPKNIEFEMVRNTEGQVWCLTVVNDQLLCGHNYGAFRIDNNIATKISATNGVWNFFKLNGENERLFSGSYNGFIIYSKDDNGRWYQKDMINLDKSLRKIVCDQDNNIWISHDYEGIYKVVFNKNLNEVESIEQYLDSAGLNGDLPFAIHTFENEFFVSTTEGNYSFDSTANKFKKVSPVDDFFSGLGKMSFLDVDNRGNIWYTAEKNMGLFRLLEDGTYVNIYTPFKPIRPLMKDGYEHIYVYDNRNVFIASLKGLIHYDPSVKKDYSLSAATHIKKVSVFSKEGDSTISNKGNKELEAELAYDKFSVAYDWNTIAFTFNCPDPENADNIEYSYRLIGISNEWSDWTQINNKEYNYLRDGAYRFEVRARNIYNSISESDLFSFQIQTPFYRSVTAYSIYILILLILLFTGIIHLKKRFEYIRSTEEERHTAAFQKKEEKLKEAQQQAKIEIENLKIDKLESSMKYKNKELANSTYHIIRKNKFLNSLKLELSKLSKAAKSEFVEQELKKISRKIDRDINNEKNWVVFDRYFDEVHQEFLERLKEKHPGLSPKELRLSAYLKMNISTKEIAPLMNISVRGVEISRYRLRKKLNLDREENLTQYLMDI